jgi:hypothetical protein
MRFRVKAAADANLQSIEDFLRKVLDRMYPSKVVSETPTTQRAIKYIWNIDKHMSASAYKYTIAFALPNFRMTVDEVKLEKGVIIRKLQPEEKEFLQKDKINELRIRTLQITYDHALEITSDKSNYAGLDTFFKQKRTLEALRLFKEGHIFIDLPIPAVRQTLKGAVKDAFDSFFISMSSFQPEMYKVQKPNYLLEKDEIDSLKKLYDIMKKVKLPPDLTIAKTWFNEALETVDSLECLIKHVIALEAIFLEGGPELTYRLSNLVASFIGKATTDRLFIKHWIREFYKMRSKIVHGGKMNYIIEWKYLSKLEKYVRVSLIKMIALRQNYEKGKLLQLIEDSIFDDTQRTKFEKEVTKFYGFEFGSL